MWLYGHYGKGITQCLFQSVSSDLWCIPCHWHQCLFILAADAFYQLSKYILSLPAEGSFERSLLLLWAFLYVCNLREHCCLAKPKQTCTYTHIGFCLVEAEQLGFICLWVLGPCLLNSTTYIAYIWYSCLYIFTHTDLSTQQILSKFRVCAPVCMCVA